MSKKAAVEKKQDKSLHVYNPPKIDFELNIREFEWNDKQKELIEAGTKKDSRIIFCQAKAGTGKTLVCLYIALKKLQEKKISKIYFVRNPVESSSKGLGFLPGTEKDKLMPYSMPALDNLNELLPQSQIKKLIDGNFIEIVPLGYLKGRSLSVCAIICDESEDMQIIDFRLVASRLGRYSSLFFIGDKRQSNVRDSGFEKVFSLFDDPESQNKGIHCIELSQVMRNDVLSYVLDKFDNINFSEQKDSWSPGQK